MIRRLVLPLALGLALGISIIGAMLDGHVGAQPLPSPTLAPGHYVADSPMQPAEARPTVSGYWEWHVGVFTGAPPAFQEQYILTWGLSSDSISPAKDWDGDGLDDIAVYRPSSLTWYVLKSNCAGGRWTCSSSYFIP